MSLQALIEELITHVQTMAGDCDQSSSGNWGQWYTDWKGLYSWSNHCNSSKPVGFTYDLLWTFTFRNWTKTIFGDWKKHKHIF